MEPRILSLHSIIRARDLAAFRSALASADVSAAERGGLLLAAASVGWPDGLSDLLAASTPADWANACGETALMLASERDHVNSVRLLLERGAAIDAKDVFGWTALFYAARGNASQVVQLLLESGAEVDVRDVRNQTALRIASLKPFGFMVPVVGWTVSGAIPRLRSTPTYKLLREASRGA